MANDIFISDLPAQSGDTTLLTDVVAQDDGTTTKKLSIAQIAKSIIENFTGSSLAGSSQSVKSAIDSLNSNRYTLIGTQTTTEIYNIVKQAKSTFLQLSGGGVSTLSNGDASFIGAGYAVYHADSSLVVYEVLCLGAGRMYTGRINGLGELSLVKALSLGTAI